MPVGSRRSGPGGPDPGDPELVRNGRAGVQDDGSQFAAWAVPGVGFPGPWLDLCAGPGGKTALLAGLAAPTAVRCWPSDLAPHRAALVVGGTRAYPGGCGPGVVVADGTVPAWHPGSFFRVLADVPCSGLGALRRRPEARWRRSRRTWSSCTQT